MAEIVNLRQARKKKDRQARRDAGDRNAARHGRAKADRTRDAAIEALETRRHDGHRRDAPAGLPNLRDQAPEDGDE